MSSKVEEEIYKKKKHDEESIFLRSCDESDYFFFSPGI